MAHIVKCRVCKREIDIDAAHDWIMPSTNYYYHAQCYDDWIKSKSERAVSVERSEEDWFTLLKDYIWRDIKLPNIDWAKVSSQWKNFLKTKNFTPKGIYFAVIYFYEIQHGNVELAKGGIGIVGQNRPILTIIDTARRNSQKSKYSLDDIGEDDDD